MGGLLWPAALAALAGITVLRWSWARKQRSAAANLAGWMLLGVAVVLAGAEAGAWGISVVSLIAMGAASLMLVHSALLSPQRVVAKRASQRVGMLPEPGEDKRLGARLATFLIVVLGGFVASLALGIGLRAVAMLLGMGEPDANATALFVVPIAWGVLATVLLMQTKRRAQITTIAIAGLLIVPAMLAGS
ncbi:MAG: hypothetical protein JY451_09345 [Erythrobacter sp.]|nr:MAG: hypothetical protein JY451_09345 [Erythrobacter sp.]